MKYNTKEEDNENIRVHRQYIDDYRQAIDSAKVTGRLDSVYLAYYDLQYRIAEQDYKVCSLNVNKKAKWFHNYNDRYLKPDDKYNGLISHYYMNTVDIYQHPFEDIIRDTTLSPESRKLLLFSHLRRGNTPLVRVMSDTQLKSYYDQYKEVTGDTVAFAVLEKEFGPLKFVPESVSMGKTILVDSDENERTLEDLVAENKGKVIYVDFWASWCGPCVGEMPGALKLRKEYAGKDVIFVYLSTDNNFKAWKEAVVTHKTAEEGGINYFIANSDTSDIVRDLKINAIPRYIIIDRTGKIVNSNAPRPTEHEQIKAELDKYL